MRLCRLNDNRLGIIDNGQIRDVSGALLALPPISWPWHQGDHLVRNFTEVATKIRQLAASAPVIEPDDVRFLSPIGNPSKIIAAPLNYTKHVTEVGRDAQIHANTHSFTYEGFRTPIDKLGLFIKASSSLVGPGEGVELVYPERRTDHEIELAVIIGREAKNISESDALSCVLGYSICLDMTVRGPEDRSFRKSPDTYSVLGPTLVTAEEIPNPEGLDLALTVNGVTKQSGNTRDLTVGLCRLIAIASSCYTLYPGDIIMTGTPDGVAPVMPGDDVVARIAGLGEMHVKVRSGAPSSGIHGQTLSR
jgi:2-keto-4-pentenoate hydratase/2-oxohepta-3-ene-1,7-dioic acid hydratase in catechol pathway